MEALGGAVRRVRCVRRVRRQRVLQRVRAGGAQRVGRRAGRGPPHRVRGEAVMGHSCGRERAPRAARRAR